MIYLLEDDDSIRKLVLYGLDSQGFQAKGFALPSEFWRAMDAEMPELVLLDIMLPEEDGLSILRKLRARPATKRLPIIMLTAKNSEYDRVIGLDHGARASARSCAGQSPHRRAAIFRSACSSSPRTATRSRSAARM